MELQTVVPNQPGHYQAYYCINKGEDKFQPDNITEVFLQHVPVLGYISVVEIGKPKVEQYVQDHREVEQRSVKSIVCSSNCILNRNVNPENPERFD